MVGLAKADSKVVLIFVVCILIKIELQNQYDDKLLVFNFQCVFGNRLLVLLFRTHMESDYSASDIARYVLSIILHKNEIRKQ